MNYFDLHCDTAVRMYLENLEFCNENLSVNSRFSSCFEKWYQCFAVFIDEKTAEPFVFYKRVLSDLRKKVINSYTQNPNLILTVEGGTLIENDLSRIYELKQDGVFSLTLTWNGENNIAGGAKSRAPLKPFGIEVIKKLNEVKIATDLSHLNNKSFYKAIEYADYPIATHSCLCEVSEHIRNINIDMLKLISQKNGIVGLCLYPDFLGSENVYDAFYKNVYICLENGFEDNIAIGSDFDGCATPLNVGDIPNLYVYLKNMGIKAEILDKLFFNNAIKYLENFDKL